MTFIVTNYVAQPKKQRGKKIMRDEAFCLPVSLLLFLFGPSMEDGQRL